MSDRNAFKELGRISRDVLDGGADAVTNARGRDALVVAVARGNRRAPAKTFGFRAVALVGVAALLAVVGYTASVVFHPIEARLGDVSLGEGAYIHADDAAQAISFSEGSEATFRAGSAGRVTHLSREGADILLERGRVKLEVAHRKGAQWRVSAGPFIVEILGTTLEVVWSPDGEQLSVTVTQGQVRVVAPTIGQHLSVEAGQTLSAQARSAEISVRPTPTASVAVASSAAPPDPLEAPEPEPEGSAEPAPAPAVPPPPKSWAKSLAEGDFERILREVDARGPDSVLETASLADLVALGDAARYGRRGALAGRCLLAVRKRFPSSKEAVNAAFLLGRAADDQGRGSEAIGYYDVYLAEAPGGPFAGEALGRKMVVVDRTSGREAARRIATTYLQKYPKGAYADVAHDLTSSP